MKPLEHLIFGMVFALILFVIFPQISLIGFFLIVASTVLIDVDHYIYYAYTKKDWSLKNAYNWFIKNGKKYHKLSENQKKDIYFGICFLHGIEAIIILFAFSFYFTFFLFIITGFIFHQFLDFIDLTSRNLSRYKLISLTYSLFYTKNKKLIEDYN